MKTIGAVLSVLVVVALARPALAATKTATLGVKGWTCGSCAASTKAALAKLDGVASVKTDHETKVAIVTYDDSRVTPDMLIQATEKIGYSATVKTVVDGAAAAPSAHGSKSATGSGTDANASAGGTGTGTGTSTRPDTSEIVFPAEDVSFFEVPLECGAAANLGCGSQSKPILRELEKDPRVASARINRPGTRLAVAWKDPAHARTGIPFVQAAFEKNDLEAPRLPSSDRDKALDEYKTGRWYGPVEVDRLSEHEAGVIIERLVKRARLTLAPDAEAALIRDLTALLAEHLTSDSPKDRAVVHEELIKAAGKHLTASQLAELVKAGEQGVQALPGEKP